VLLSKKLNRAAELFADFTITSMRENCCGSAPIVDNEFSVELVSNIILKLKRGKAAGLDSLTAKHLIHCHSSLPCILSKLFNLMLWYGYLPREFGQSYTVPLIKDTLCHTKSTLCSDFRGIAINCILSKVLEHCILDRFNDFFSTNDNQFG
jgi:hypothetical protein